MNTKDRLNHSFNKAYTDGELLEWAHKQRELRKRNLLSKERIAKLDAIAFDWEGKLTESQKKELEMIPGWKEFCEEPEVPADNLDSIYYDVLVKYAEGQRCYPQGSFGCIYVDHKGKVSLEVSPSSHTPSEDCVLWFTCYGHDLNDFDENYHFDGAKNKWWYDESQGKKAKPRKTYISKKEVERLFNECIIEYFETTENIDEVKSRIEKVLTSTVAEVIPADPEKAYEGKGWKGWDDFLGTKEGGQ